MMSNNPEKPESSVIPEKLSEYRIFGLSLLQLMAIVGAIGIIATLILTLVFQ